MKRIDSETVQKILDSANIVEVVSDFVSLKRRGANYIGLCPFHNERTPSFSVSPAKGICKCFSCGKGGSPVNFIMEHEQMSFNEALRYLAKKYNIDIKEHEMSDKEREEESARENMFAVNEFALTHFKTTLTNTTDGNDIGLAYFRERGISDEAIRRFHLGYSLERGNTLYNAAIKAGYNEQSLIDTGLCIKRDDGQLYDRFKGRVIYPIHTISGKVVAFGGRTLSNDKKTAKYVNSPESIIYSKSRELYGLYQAKKSIVEKKKCILVEGYMDVISMSQSGIENVVASSGTSLTEGQIRLIHRFTDNVTVIYDSDPAGIKASLRGIDMLLAEGLNIKVVLLPEGDDPDSFAQSHSATEVEQYISDHETDFIRFKTDILLNGVENDPVSRAKVITDVVQSISVIPDEITMSVYVQECSRRLEIDEKVLLLQIKKFIAERLDKQQTKKQRESAILSIEPTIDSTNYSSVNNKSSDTKKHNRAQILYPYEETIIRYVIRYGMVELDSTDEYGKNIKVRVIDYILDELNGENITFSNEMFSQVLDECMRLINNQWAHDYSSFESESIRQYEFEKNTGCEEITKTATDLDQIKQAETLLENKCNQAHINRMDEFRHRYLSRNLASSPSETCRRITNELANSRYRLSKVHSKFTHIETERDRLEDLLPRAIFGLKDAIISCDIAALRENLRELSATPENHDLSRIQEIMGQISALNNLRSKFSKYLGERVILPK